MLTLRSALLLLAIGTALFFAWRLHAPRGSFYSGWLGLLMVAFGVECIGAITSHLGIRNVVLYNGYAMLEFIFLLYLVRQLRPPWNQGLLVAMAFGVVGMGYSVIIHGVTSYLALEGLLIISVVSSTVFLMLLLDLARTSIVPLQRNSFFWLFVGALFYFGGVIPVLGSWRFMGQLSRALSQSLYWIVVLLAIVRYVLAAIACHMERLHIEHSGGWKVRSN